MTAGPDSANAPSSASRVLMILSTGYFIGFTTYVPVQRVRARLLLTQERDAENALLARYIGREAPPIVSETLDGQRWSLADQRGKVVLVFVWSILCDDCVAAIPALNGMYSTYRERDDFVLVGVHGFPERDVVSSYCSAKGITWPQLYERSESLQKRLSGHAGHKEDALDLPDRQGWHGEGPPRWTGSDRGRNPGAAGIAADELTHPPVQARPEVPPVSVMRFLVVSFDNAQDSN